MSRRRKRTEAYCTRRYCRHSVRKARRAFRTAAAQAIDDPGNILGTHELLRKAAKRLEWREDVLAHVPKL